MYYFYKLNAHKALSILNVSSGIGVVVSNKDGEFKATMAKPFTGFF